MVDCGCYQNWCHFLNYSLKGIGQLARTEHNKTITKTWYIHSKMKNFSNILIYDKFNNRVQVILDISSMTFSRIIS